MTTLEICLLSITLVALLTLIIFLIVNKKQGKQNFDKEFIRSREEMDRNFKNLREELYFSLKTTREEINTILGGRINDFTKSNEQKLEKIRETVENKLESLQKDNSEKIEKMRMTVDEKLHDTLEKRLGESFKLVNDRLESVYKGLGEMQTLAVGVGDLKKVLTNVKQRGSWGEIRLEQLLGQYLTEDQYVKNAKTNSKSKDFVEFAIKIPSKVDGQIVLLPVDSKFPIEAYNRLVEAEEAGDTAEILSCRKELERSVKKHASDISNKYLNPPYTTDFAVMFLPTESLFCEVLKNTSLMESLQREQRITITGPTTLTAFISSLQLGFHALAIEKQTSEVWKVLATIKTEFGKFGDILAKTNKKIQEVANSMKDAESKTRNIERKLNKVDSLAYSNSQDILPEMNDNTDDESE